LSGNKTIKWGRDTEGQRKLKKGFGDQTAKKEKQFSCLYQRSS